MTGNVVLGVTGGIAAYKSVYLLRLLRRSGLLVRVVMTPSAREFVAPLTFSTLSGYPVYEAFHEPTSGEWHSHVSLAEWADVMVIAPATANTVGKLSHGIADNLLTTTALAARAPIVLAPAMDAGMYENVAVQQNLSALRARGVRIVEPAAGWLASGLQGKGRMAEPESIHAEVFSAIGVSSGLLSGVKALVTMGGTREAIDPVRCLTNHSSGRMGRAVVEALAREGASVTVLCAGAEVVPEESSSVSVLRTMSAREMYDEATRLWPEMEVGVMAAAVADFTPVSSSVEKIDSQEAPDLKLEPTKDIAAALGKAKSAKQILVGFALETDEETAHAHEKLQRKHLDLCVYNRQEAGVSGTGTTHNRAILLYPNGNEQFRGSETKESLAEGIVRAVVNLRAGR